MDEPLPAFFPETPWEAVQETTQEKVFVDDRVFQLRIPVDSDRLLDHPAVRAAFAADEFLPYWADLWPSARMLAKAIVREPWPPMDPPLRAIEIGCGLGLPGIAALSCGLHVTFSDYDLTALRFAADNARRNGFTAFDTLPLDWRHPPADRRFEVVLGSDLIYEERSVAPVAALIERLLAPGGLALLTDENRPPSANLRSAFTAVGLTFSEQMLRAGPPGGPRSKGTLYRLRRSEE